MRPAASPLKVWTNNAWVAALCIALGVLGLPVILLLLNNILNVAIDRWPDVRPTTAPACSSG